MAMFIDTGVATIAEALGGSLRGALEQAIKARLMEQAEVIVSQTARELADNLQARIDSWRGPFDGSAQVSLIIDGVREIAVRKERR